MIKLPVKVSDEIAARSQALNSRRQSAKITLKIALKHHSDISVEIEADRTVLWADVYAEYDLDPKADYTLCNQADGTILTDKD